mmetsp:Transcript_64764/g.173516  ORF Transcript_64764/g.173516 Transcript_64764/m.173516 type:complete len:257 (+) Transcript_64764:2530-3300(+)
MVAPRLSRSAWADAAFSSAAAWACRSSSTARSRLANSCSISSRAFCDAARSAACCAAAASADCTFSMREDISPVRRPRSASTCCVCPRTSTWAAASCFWSSRFSRCSASSCSWVLASASARRRALSRSCSSWRAVSAAFLSASWCSARAFASSRSLALSVCSRVKILAMLSLRAPVACVNSDFPLERVTSKSLVSCWLLASRVRILEVSSRSSLRMRSTASSRSRSWDMTAPFSISISALVVPSSFSRASSCCWRA